MIKCTLQPCKDRPRLVALRTPVQRIRTPELEEDDAVESEDEELEEDEAVESEDEEEVETDDEERIH